MEFAIFVDENKTNIDNYLKTNTYVNKAVTVDRVVVSEGILNASTENAVLLNDTATISIASGTTSLMGKVSGMVHF